MKVAAGLVPILMPINMWRKYQAQIYFILFLLQITLVYKLIQWNFVSGQTFKLALDDKIPFVALFVVPYILYLAVLIGIFVLATKDKRLFLATAKTFFWAALVCNLFFILLPTMVNRISILPANIFDKLVIFIYSIDTAKNSFPSEHVTFTVLANLCLIQISRVISWFLLPLTCLIVISTVLIKQHYLPDIIGGLALAWLVYHYIFKKHFPLIDLVTAPIKED